MAVDLGGAEAADGLGARASDEHPQDMGGVGEHRRPRERSVVEDVRVGGRGRVAPQPELGRQHNGMPGGAGSGDADPGRKVGHTRAGQHGVGAGGSDPRVQLARPPHGRRLPCGHGRRLVDREGGFVVPPRLGVDPAPEPLDALLAQPPQVVVLIRRFQVPVPGEGVEVAAAGIAGQHPEVDVLAVALHRSAASEQPAGMGPHRRLGHGQDAVGGEAHEVGPGREVVDHPFDGDDGASPRRHRPPVALEQRRVQGHVPLGVGGHAMNQRHVGYER